MGTILEEEEILHMLRSDIKDSGGQTAWARKHQVDRTVLSKVLHGHYPVTLSIAKALNLRRVYIRD
jgi:DNA-binding phage protein